MKNYDLNGSWAETGHKGTHRNKCFLEIAKTLKDAAAKDAAAEEPEKVKEALDGILTKTESGAFRAKKYK